MSRRRAMPPNHSPYEALEAELRGLVRGEVRFDAGSRALYATDASNYRQLPIGVVFPRDEEDVVQAVAACRRHDAPVLPRGGGTSLAGQCCNVAVVLEMSKYMTGILELDVASRRARVQPGLVLDDLRDAAERHRFTFGPDPSTYNRCTLGGMIGNNSCGVHSVMAGKTEENTEELDVLLYEGLRLRVGCTTEPELDEIIRFGGRRGEIYGRLRSLRDKYSDKIRECYPAIPRRVSGYNLNHLLPENGFNVARALVGSEGTCAIVLQATLRLVPSPPARALVVLGYPDVYSAGDHVAQILEFGPIGLEAFDDILVDSIKHKGLHPGSTEQLPNGKGWLLVEFGGDTPAEAQERVRLLIDRLGQGNGRPTIKRVDDPLVARTMWKVRESGLGATARMPDGRDTWEGWEDAAVPPAKLGDYLRDFRQLMLGHGYEGTLYGHFGDGCVHTRIDFDLASTEGVARYRRFVSDAADLVVRYGGSLSGEHGDGQSRAELLHKMFGPELVEAFREFKAIWDPSGKMNPGKVVDAYRLDENLRHGPGHAPKQVQTHFSYPGSDRGSFARATLRCVGVGECRRSHEGTMCPSYMVTREEKHSTRGRARLLFEMLQGEVISDGWKSEEVRDALDLCLACKGCKRECPVSVDMATYKAEFLAHYYQGRLRPRHAYAFGLIGRWARFAELSPALANFFTQTPSLGRVAKATAGIATQRRIPAFAAESFKRGFHARQRTRRDGPRVILWADTFNNHFKPATAHAAVTVLERAGYTIDVPRQWLCCGRPLYDYGMLDTAVRWLRRILTTLRADIRAGTPVIGLEPSCVAVFRDELPALFPDDEDAQRLSRQTYHLSEFLVKHAPTFAVPALGTKALVHGHCHHKAVMTMNDEIALLRKLGLDLEVLDAGCCGMAGAFGFEKEHYDVSVRCGERVLLPAIRNAAQETLIVADGFSCREQIEQGTGRHTMHLADVLAIALQHEREAPTSKFQRSQP
ncbi:MAG: FAD-binding and (Fe-S)-binding domain-containing protein [Gemmatimonadaceae bacterium]